MKDTWIKRASSISQATAMRALRTRIELRNKNKREPSASEVRAHLQCQFTDNSVIARWQPLFDLARKCVQKSILSHYEKEKVTEKYIQRLVLEGIQCTKYDSHLAAMIQSAVQASDEDD